jgi:hypothetical protein
LASGSLAVPNAPTQPDQWVHATNANSLHVGGLFGWRDDSSPTGWWSGIVTEVGSMRVHVRDVRPAVVKHPARD